MLIPPYSRLYKTNPTAGCFGPVTGAVENIMPPTKSGHLATGKMQLSSGTGKAFGGPTLVSGICLAADITFTLGQFQGSVNTWQSAVERSGPSTANPTTTPCSLVYSKVLQSRTGLGTTGRSSALSESWSSASVKIQLVDSHPTR